MNFGFESVKHVIQSLSSKFTCHILLFEKEKHLFSFKILSVCQVILSRIQN